MVGGKFTREGTAMRCLVGFLVAIDPNEPNKEWK